MIKRNLLAGNGRERKPGISKIIRRETLQVKGNAALEKKLTIQSFLKVSQRTLKKDTYKRRIER